MKFGARIIIMESMSRILTGGDNHNCLISYRNDTLLSKKRANFFLEIYCFLNAYMCSRRFVTIICNLAGTDGLRTCRERDSGILALLKFGNWIFCYGYLAVLLNLTSLKKIQRYISK